MADPSPIRFRAFLSYSHRDDRWGRWLHRALENTRVAKDLVGRATPFGAVPPTLRPVFRDRDDYSPGESLSDKTRAALAASDFLIVVCSPNSAKSFYCNEEIRLFKAMGRGGRVLPVIVDGEPGDPERECFPPALRFKVDLEGRLTDQREEPLAADARPDKDGREGARLKLVAGLLGLALDEIVRRAERERRRILAMWVGGLAVLAVVLAGLGGLAEINRREAARQRDAVLVSQSRYISRLAVQRAAEGDVGTALALALEVLPQRLDKPDRPFDLQAEQALIEALNRLQELRHLALEYGINVALFSPDGKKILIGSNDKVVRLWDASSGRVLQAISGHQAPITTAAFSPDGARIATGSDDGEIRIWEAASGTAIAVLDKIDDHGIAISFSSDGNQLLINSGLDSVRLWDGRGAAASLTVQDGLRAAAFLDNGTKLVALEKGGMLQVRDLPSGRLLGSLEGQEDVFAAGSGLLAVGFDGKSSIWRGVAWQPVPTIEEPGATVIYSPDSSRALILETGEVWDIAAGRVVARYAGHAGSILAGAFSANGQVIATVGEDRGVHLWAAETGDKLKVLHGHKAKIRSVAFAPGHPSILTSADDGSARLWSISSALDRGPLVGNGGSLSPDGRLAIARTDEGKAIVSDVESRREVWRSGDGVFAAAFSPDSRRVFAFSADAVLVLDAADGRQLRRTALLDAPMVGYAVFSRDGERVIVAATEDSTLFLYDASTGRQLARLPHADEQHRWAVFSPDGKWIVTNDYKAVRLWTAAGEVSRTLHEGDDAVTPIGFSPDSRWVVTGRAIWEVATGRQVADLGHNGMTMSFSGDGSLVAFSGAYGPSSVYKVPSGEQVAELHGHEHYVSGVAFSPDGRRLASVSRDTTLRIWSVADGTQIGMYRLDDEAFRVEFSSDGQRLLVVGLQLTSILPHQTGQALIDRACQVMPRPLSYAQRVEHFLDREPRLLRCGRAPIK